MKFFLILFFSTLCFSKSFPGYITKVDPLTINSSSIEFFFFKKDNNLCIGRVLFYSDNLSLKNHIDKIFCNGQFLNTDGFINSLKYSKSLGLISNSNQYFKIEQNQQITIEIKDF